MATILKQLFSLILPVTALIIVPLLIEQDLSVSPGIISITGLILIAAGLILLVFTISMFIRIGRGTLAPWSPTQKLVISGVYAYVRNPMISAVFITLIGESFFFHSQNIFIWALIFFIFNTIYFIVSEEPGLEKRFGEEYLVYKTNVPRWIPRFTPYKKEQNNTVY